MTDETNLEQWAPIPKWEGYYEVSTAGRIRSLPRISDKSVAYRRVYGGGIVRPIMGGRGYLLVNLTDATRREQMAIHVAVLTAFVGPRPPKYHACHNDGIKTNNGLSNLRWDTCAANHDDKRRHGTMPMGEQHPNAKLTEADIKEIRALPSSRGRIVAYAQNRNIPLKTVYSIRCKGWAHVR